MDTRYYAIFKIDFNYLFIFLHESFFIKNIKTYFFTMLLIKDRGISGI